jgi:hypothetical protein
MKRTFFIFLSLISLVFLSAANEPRAAVQAQTGQETEGSTDTVDSDGYKTAASAGIVLKWKVSGDRLDCLVRGSTKGWIAAGFNSADSMNGARLIIGYVDEKGIHIRADQGKGHSHKAMIVQDITGAFGNEKHGLTEIGFSIPLDPGTKDGFVLVPGRKIQVLLAMGKSNNFNAIHVKKTSVVITL